MLELGGGPDGAISADGRVMGCYVHGLFAADRFRHEFLHALRPRAASEVDYGTGIDQVLDRLARHLENYLAIDRMLALAGYTASPSATTMPSRAPARI
jgi:adenosylcobyric acid synthase